MTPITKQSDKVDPSFLSEDGRNERIRRKIKIFQDYRKSRKTESYLEEAEDALGAPKSHK